MTVTTKKTPAKKKAAKKKLLKPTKKKVIRRLRCKLTDKEKLAAGNRMADARAEVGRLEADLTSVKKEMAAKIQEQDAIMTQASELVRTGFESRQVHCEFVLDYQKGVAKTLRMDTRKIIEKRDLTQEERQRKLDFEGTGK